MRDSKDQLPFQDFVPSLGIALDLDLPERQKDRALSVRIDSGIYRALEKAGEEWGCSTSDALRRVLNLFFGPELFLGILQQQASLYLQQRGLRMGMTKKFGTKYTPASQTLDYLESLATYYQTLLHTHAAFVSTASELKERADLIINGTNKMREYFRDEPIDPFESFPDPIHAQDVKRNDDIQE